MFNQQEKRAESPSIETRYPVFLAKFYLVWLKLTI